jgi:tetratricopeptide (TPR) repeat protein
MGVLGPGARYLYYVTDEFNTYDLFLQSPVNSAGEPLFEAFGDIIWPAISPDGKEVAYIRYETDSRGDACRRRIKSNGKARNDREECRDTEEADLQIYWRTDGRLGVLLREQLHGDHVLLDGAFEKDPKRTDANVVGLAISSDERWVAYVPLSRLRDEVGVSFANQTSAEGIRVRRALPGAKELEYAANLPGVSGYPVFSPDGAYLYFSQFLNDTNRDGVIDGEDNGVLFRVPFRGDGEPPEFGKPRQLTNAQWNCHYPSIREETMALTCAIDENIHIYVMPPSGTVPSDWDRERIAREVERVHNPWSELVLRQHLLVSAAANPERSAQLKALTKLHLDLREYEAAIHYAEQRGELFRSDGQSDWWSQLMIRLAKHRRADRGLSRGRFSEEYLQESNGLAESVKSVATDGSGNALALRALVLARIYGDLGDKASAVELLRAIDISSVTDETVLDFAFQEFDRFYGLLGAHDKRLARLREIALHPDPSVTESLRHSKRFVELLQRGRSQDERLERLLDARKAVPDQTRLALALDLEIALQQLTEENAEAVERQLVDLYTRVENAHVRRYLVISALRAANREGVESLQHSLVELWVESAEQGDPDRQASAALYRLVVLERAYGAFAAGDWDTAASYFDKARRATDSLAGHVGYWMARDLGAIETNKELGKVVDNAKELLEAAIDETPDQPLMHLLLAHALHHRGMRLGDRQGVALAVRHYLLALDLSDRRPRVRAPAHAGMALAQASLGNHRRALEDYEARFELPTISTEEQAALLLGYARSLFHVNQKDEAVEAAKKALSQIQSDAGAAEDLARYEPLALDRLALYQLDAERMKDALVTHEALQRSLDVNPEAASEVNAVKTEARLATAYLVTEDPKSALRSVIEGEARLEGADPLRRDDIERRLRPVTHELVYQKKDFEVLLAGLEANAARQLDELQQARAALLFRKEALDAHYSETQVDEDLLELARTCLRLADIAQQRGDLEQTRQYLEAGLGYAEQHATVSGSEVSEAGFHLLRAYALLHFEGGVDLAVYQRDLERDLLRYYLFLCEVRNPEWETERMRLEVFLSLLRMETSPVGH